MMSHGSPMIPWLNIKHNLYLPAALNGRLRMPTMRDVEDILDRLNLSSRILTTYPHMLSAGMAQRCAVARCLLYDPTFLLIDELFSGLDSVNSDDLANVLGHYVQNHTVACLVVTHNIYRASRISTRCYYLLQSGHLRDMGPEPTEDCLRVVMREDCETQRKRIA